MSEIRILFKFQDNRRSATEEEKTMSIPPSQTDVKLFAQDDDEKLFDIVNSPLASFHESERSCHGTSDQVSESPLVAYLYSLKHNITSLVTFYYQKKLNGLVFL